MKMATLNKTQGFIMLFGLLVPLSVLWPYFFDFGKIANIENTAYITFPLIKYADHLLNQSVLYWSFSGGVGAPWPIPFGMTHTPFVFLYNFLPPMTVLGLTIYCHAVISFFSVLKIARYLNFSIGFQLLAGVTFFYTTSIEYLFWGDAPEVYLVWLLFPIILTCLIELGNAKNLGLSIFWSISLGLSVGYTALNGHVGIMVNYIFILGLFVLLSPNIPKKIIPYLLLSIMLSCIVFGEKLYFYLQESIYFSDQITRQHGHRPDIFYVIWNIVFKPIPMPLSFDSLANLKQVLVDLYANGRSIGFGLLLFVSATYGTFKGKLNRDNLIFPFSMCFVISLLLFFFPDKFLPDAISSFVVFKDTANFFGILAGCYWLQHLKKIFKNRAKKTLSRVMIILIIVHLNQIVIGSFPYTLGPIIFPQNTFHSMQDLNLMKENPSSFPYLAFFKNQKNYSNPRVVITGDAFLEARLNQHNKVGLVTNWGYLLDVRELSSVLKGVSMDQISLSQSKPYGSITGENLSGWKLDKDLKGWPTQDQNLLSLLGVNYVVDVTDNIPQARYLEKVTKINSADKFISIYENKEKWGEILEVDPDFFNQTPIKKLNCNNFSLSCLDLEKMKLRQNKKINNAKITYEGNSIKIDLDYNLSSREFILATMHRKEWKVYLGEGVTIQNWFGLIRLKVPKGVTNLELEFYPTYRVIARFISLFLLISGPLYLLIYAFYRRKYF